MKLLGIAGLGALGSVLRYLLDGWVQRCVASNFPWGTLGVNVLGSFLIALVMQVAGARGALDSTTRIVITVGLLGGFTTYSSFNQQTLELLRERDYAHAALYVVGTVSLGLLAGVLGLGSGRLLAGGG